jgi:hypothetical protein
MAGPGVAPLDPSTPVGQVRANIGDTNFTALAPPVDGMGFYEWMSDDEILASLNTASGSVYRATGMAMLGLARDFVATGRAIKTDDLSMDSRNRGKDYLSIAMEWLKQADLQDVRDSAGLFDLVSPDRTCEPGGRFGDIAFPFRAF